MASKNNSGYGWLTGDAAPQSGGYTSRWAKYASEQAKKQAEADFQAQQTQQAEQAKQDNKNIFQKAGDFVGSTAKTIGSGIEQGLGAVADTAVQGGAVIDTISNDLSGRTAKEEKAIADQQAADLKRIQEIGKQLKDPKTSDADKAKLRTELQTVSSRPVAKTSNQQSLETAQNARDWIHNQTDFSGDKISGTSGADQAASNINAGHGSLEDWKKLGLTSLNVGASATMFVNPVAGGLKAGAEQSALKVAGKNIANNAIVGAVSGGANAGANDQNVLEGALQGAAAGGALGAAGEAFKGVKGAIKGKKTGEVQPNVVDNTTPTPTVDPNAPPKPAGLLGDGLPSSKDIAAQIQDLQNGNYSPDLMQTADNNAAKIADPNFAKDQAALSANYDKELKALDKNKTLDPQAKADAATKINNKYEQLNNQLDQKYTQPSDTPGVPSGTGTSTTVNTDAVKAKFAELQTQYKDALAREANLAQSAANERLAAAPKVADVQTEINNYNAGNKPDQLYTPDQRPQDMLDVINNPKLPEQVRKSAQAVYDQAQQAHLQNGNFMDTVTYNRSRQDFIDKYNADIKDLNAMPDSPYKQQKIDELTNNLDQNMQTLDGLYQDGAQARAHDQAITDHVNQMESKIVMDAQHIMDANPNDYRTLNTQADAAYQQELHAKLAEAKTAEFMRPTETQGSVAATDELVHAADTSQSPQEFVDKMNTDPVTQKAVDVVAGDADTAAVAMNQNPMSTSIVGRTLGIPRNVLRSWGEAGKQFADKLDNAMFDYTSHRGQQILRIRQWDELLGKSDAARTRVFDALDSGNVSKLSADELTVYKDAREYFSEMADKLGIDPEGRISNYVPHLIKNQTGKEAAALDQTIQMLKYGKDAKGNPLTSTVRRNLTAQLSGLDPATMRYLDLNTSYQFKNGFLEHRTGAPEFQKNLMSVVNLYDTLGARKVYLEPAMQDIAKTVADKGNGFSAAQQRYVTDLFNNLRGTNKSEFASAIDGMIQKIIPVNDPSGRIIRGFRRLTNAGLMGGSVSTALKNTQAFVNIAAKINPKDLPHAIISAGKSLKADSAEWRELYQAGVMDASFSNFIRDISHQGGSKVTQTIDKAEVPLWTMMRNVDQLGRATAYFAKRDSFLKGIGKTLDNATPEELRGAMKAGRVGARDTSFEFTPLDVPVALDGDMGKLALQMQSWNLQQAAFIKNLIKGHEDSLITNGKLNAKGAYSLLAFAAGTAGFYYTVGEVTGMKPADLVPFGSDVTQGQMPQSPIMNLLGIGGDAQNPGLYQIATASDTERGNIASKVGSKFLTNLIPGSAQFQRTVNGIDSTTSGVSKNKNGQVQFIQNIDPASQLRAAVVGKYTTQNGHEWVTNGFPTLSDSQSGVVDKLGTQESKQKATDFFVALNNAPGRQDAVTNVKDAVKAGDINKATRLANEYNQKVRDALKKYYADHGDLHGTVGYDRNGNELTGSSYLNDKLINVSKYEGN